MSILMNQLSSYHILKVFWKLLKPLIWILIYSVKLTNLILYKLFFLTLAPSDWKGKPNEHLYSHHLYFLCSLKILIQKWANPLRMRVSDLKSSVIIWPQRSAGITTHHGIFVPVWSSCSSLSAPLGSEPCCGTVQEKETEHTVCKMRISPSLTGEAAQPMCSQGQVPSAHEFFRQEATVFPCSFFSRWTSDCFLHWPGAFLSPINSSILSCKKLRGPL